MMKLIGFNSQRDGILLCSAAYCSCEVVVSIPNGMEFYLKAILYEAGDRICFNSQRDGILLKHSYIGAFRMMFQFPTGWNSTSADNTGVYKYDSFNSQRDGILLSWKDAISGIATAFQFPTGWNSTNPLPTNQARPNSFNSQRDGILLLNTNRRNS